MKLLNRKEWREKNACACLWKMGLLLINYMQTFLYAVIINYGVCLYESETCIDQSRRVFVQGNFSYFKISLYSYLILFKSIGILKKAGDHNQMSGRPSSPSCSAVCTGRCFVHTPPQFTVTTSLLLSKAHLLWLLVLRLTWFAGSTLFHPVFYSSVFHLIISFHLI